MKTPRSPRMVARDDGPRENRLISKRGPAPAPGADPPAQQALTRRGFLAGVATGLGAAALGTGCSSSTAPGGSLAPVAGDGPEIADLKFGIIALTDCSPIVIAHEKGFFKKYGI